MGSSTGQIAYECAMVTKFGMKNPFALLGSRVMQWSSGVNQKAIAQKCLKPENVANVALALEQEK